MKIKTLYGFKEFIEEHEFVKEVTEIFSLAYGVCYMKIKCNDKYLASILAGETTFESFLNRARIYHMPYGIELKYEIEVEIEES